jgi:uncharacterized protein
MSLIGSCKSNNLEEVKHWLATGANVNAVDKDGRTALWWAASRGHVECATALIDAEADVNKGDKDGDTPLHRASLRGHAECIRVRRFCVVFERH